jgi:serine/threonine protein kinase/Tfp pilus assembly protein PilF
MNLSSCQSDRIKSTPTITDCFPDLNPELAAVRDQALCAMAADWNGGKRTPAEHWLQRYPLLAVDEQAAVQLIYEEICLREERGEIVRSSEIYRRFPQWKKALRLLVDCHQLIQGDEAGVRFPEEGDSLGELQLVRRLGQGAAGRVFLATQPSLSDRPLVVKLTPRRGDEHLSLARLQHTNIVPLYLAQDFPERKLRAICMPYLGGASLASILEALGTEPPMKRSGRRITELLEVAQTDLPLEQNRSGPALQFLARATYVQAVCWIGASLADALHYAHQRGLVHLDVKPSNVLIGGDGQPMLLDFHLARDIVPANSKSFDHLGGTRNYMSPEQKAAAAALREGRDNPEPLDGRSDIYSLGVLLYESLSGKLPTAVERESRRTLRLNNPAVGQGLEDVVHKCLRRRTDDRYCDAGQLATDLRCSLADLPLQGAPNRSVRERWHKWRRRKPHALAVSTALLAVLVVVTVSALAFRWDRLNAARTALELSDLSLAKSDFATAVEQLENGWSAIQWIPGQQDLKRDLQARLNGAKRGRLAATVRNLVEQLRFLDSADSVPGEQLRRLDAACAALWKNRQKIVELGALTPGSPGASDLRTDLTDLAISWAALRSRLMSPGLTGVDRIALQTLDDARTLCGDSFALNLARREYATPVSGAAVPDEGRLQPKPETADDYYAMGRYLFKSGKMTDAAQQFRRANELQPNAFWPYFYSTLCAYRLGDYERAVNAASICVALSPDRAPCFYNRAMCRQALGQNEQSLNDLDSALRIDPGMAVAWLRRGIIRAEMQQYSEAMADFARAVEQSSNPADAYYQMALVDVARKDRDAALTHLNVALQHDRDHAGALNLKERLTLER